MSSSIKSMMVRVILCIEVFFLISSVMGDYRDFRDNGNKRFCGRELRDALALLCDGEYNSIIQPSKRSDGYYNDQPWDAESIIYQQYPRPLLAKLLPQSSALLSSQIRPRVRRGWIARRGVHDECCVIPCVPSTLKSYCKTPEKPKKK